MGNLKEIVRGKENQNLKNQLTVSVIEEQSRHQNIETKRIRFDEKIPLREKMEDIKPTLTKNTRKQRTRAKTEQRTQNE